jgi:hypothetical protein
VPAGELDPVAGKPLFDHRRCYVTRLREALGDKSVATDGLRFTIAGRPPINQGYIGPDHKVIDMKSFYAALVQALGARTGTKFASLMSG